MKRYSKYTAVAAAAIIGISWQTSAQASFVTFTDRGNVDILNSDTAVIAADNTAGGSPAPAAALIGGVDNLYWDSGSPSAPTTLTMNFNTVRDIQTIKLNQFGGLGINDATIETSSDGVTWSAPLAHTASVPDNVYTTLTLNSPANAQYLRITGTSYAAGSSDRWVVHTMQVYGAAGQPLVADHHLDVVSGSAFPGGVTLTLNGISSVNSTTAFVDDAVSLSRKVLFNINANSSFTLQFGQPILMDKFGFMSVPGFTDPSLQFHVETSMNGSSWTPVLTQNGGVADDQNFFNLTPTIGEYLRFTADSTTTTRLGDVFVFTESIPEPSTVLLLGMGGLLVWRKMRR